MIIETPKAMLAAGLAFAERLAAGDWVTLSGGLGAGKTLFCKGVLEGLGFEGDVPSPTFTIMNHYTVPDVKIPVIHADLYRLKGPEELDELGLLDSEMADSICMIEWPEQGGSVFDNARFRISIQTLGENLRELRIDEKL